MVRIFRVWPLFLAGFAASAHAGVYGGAGVGADFVQYSENAHISQPGNFDVINRGRFSGTGVFGTLFAGVNRIHNRWYLAGEINGNLSSEKFQAENNEYIHHSFSRTRYKMSNQYGISAIPGFQFTPDTLFYGRLAYANAQFRTQTNDISLKNISKRLSGFRYGGGISRQLNAKTAIRVDYSLVSYGEVHMRTFDATSKTTKITGIKPFQQLAELGFVYAIA